MKKYEKYEKYEKIRKKYEKNKIIYNYINNKKY